MTPKQKWYCFWVILAVSILLLTAFLGVTIHNPQASFYTVISNIWDAAAGR